MTRKEFERKYGRLHLRRQIGDRIPVTPGKAAGDPNRRLMIKFKYNDMTSDEETLFHESVKNLIYKVMHTNNVMMDWEDVYQEIWKKISRCKCGWKENKGTYVSTWITIVANSVINTLREKVRRRNSRMCLYDDIGLDDERSGCAGFEQGDAVEEFFNDGAALMDRSFVSSLYKDSYRDFVRSLDPVERRIMDAVHEKQEEIIDGFERRNTKMPLQMIRQSLGYDESTFIAILSCIYRKYCEICDRAHVSAEKHGKSREDSEEETLF